MVTVAQARDRARKKVEREQRDWAANLVRSGGVRVTRGRSDAKPSVAPSVAPRIAPEAIRHVPSGVTAAVTSAGAPDFIADATSNFAPNDASNLPPDVVPSLAPNVAPDAVQDVMLEVVLHPPTERAVLADQPGAIAWVRSWREIADANPAVEVTWGIRQWPSVGAQSIPERCVIRGADAIATFAGAKQSAHWRTLRDRATLLGCEFLAMGDQARSRAGDPTSSGAAADGTGPSDAVPDDAVPDGAVAGDAVLSESIPHDGAPVVEIPGHAALGDAALGDAARGEAMPGDAGAGISARSGAEPDPPADDADTHTGRRVTAHALMSAVRTHARTLQQLSGSDFDTLVHVVAWLRDHPSSGLRVRQLPIRGIDTKWLERHRAVVEALCSAISGRESLGLLGAPNLVRVRFLDPALRPGGLCDVVAPVEELAAMNVAPRTVYIFENLETMFSMPEVPGAVVVHGAGYGVGRLAQIPWIRQGRILYWGDLDSDGFAILHRLRSGCENVVSILMDEDTLLEYRDLWVAEKKAAGGTYPSLTAGEQRALARIRTEGNVRLEQERIAWQTALPRLLAAAWPPS